MAASEIGQDPALMPISSPGPPAVVGSGISGAFGDKRTGGKSLPRASKCPRSWCRPKASGREVADHGSRAGPRRKRARPKPG